jgi:hypothetical protein
LKALRDKKQIMYKGKPIKIIADFSPDKLKARKTWSKVFQALKENNFIPRILYPAKLSFIIGGGIKVFYNKQKPKQYTTTNPQQQKILKGILHTEDKNKHNHKKTGCIKLHEKNRQELRKSMNWLYTVKSLNNKNN